jgi:hypothetical protein
MSRRGIVLAAVAWCAVVALTSAVAWVAIDRAGRAVFAGSAARPPGVAATGAPQVQVTSAPRPTSSRPTAAAPSPSAHPHGTTRPRSTGSASTSTHGSSSGSGGGSGSSGGSSPTTTSSAVDRSVRVPGGQVGVRCVGRTVSLRYATPANGWRVEVEDRGPGQVKVSFTASGGEQRESEVEAECEAGVPVFSTSADDGGSDAGGSDGSRDD